MLNLIAVAAALSLTQFQMQSTMTDTTLTITVSRPTRIAASGAAMYAVIEATSETSSGAIARVGEKIKVVTDSLARMGTRAIADKPIPYRLGAIIPQAGYAGYPSPSSGGFVTHYLLRIRVPNIQDLATVQAVLLSAGAASITGQSFEMPESDSTWALNVNGISSTARSAAATLAGAQGKRLGRLLGMSSNAYGGGSQSSQISLDPRSPSYGVAPEVVTTNNITLTFQLLPAN